MLYFRRTVRTDPMKTLFVAWQSPDNRRGWYPVGRLDADPAEGLYRFQYIRGAERAAAEGGFHHLVAFPLLHEVYESAELFPLFANRVLSPTRPEYKSLSDMLKRPEAALDPLELLELAGGVRQTDHLEVFPCHALLCPRLASPTAGEPATAGSPWRKRRTASRAGDQQSRHLPRGAGADCGLHGAGLGSSLPGFRSRRLPTGLWL